MHKKSVPVGALQFGMYVAELDRPWTETPFAFQGFWLRTEQQLVALRKFCRHVYVDAARSETRAMAWAPAARPPTSDRDFEIHGKAGYAPQTDLAREIQAAAGLY